MRYEIVAEAYRDLERPTARLELIDRRARMVAATPAELLPAWDPITPDTARSRENLALVVAALENHQ